MRTALLSSLLMLSACGVPSASADAVMPPPNDCPKGQVGVTSHGGPACVLIAPTDCPVGWRGMLGGKCVVEACSTDDQCDKGKHCRPADLCMHEYMQEWGWGMATPPPRPHNDPFVLAEPPHRFDPPRRVQEIVDICRADRGKPNDPADAKDASCPPDSKCIKSKVCLPDGTTKPSAWRPKPAKK